LTAEELKYLGDLFALEVKGERYPEQGLKMSHVETVEK